MTDSIKLKEAIQRSGYRIHYIAEALNLTYQGFKLKVDGEREFKASEISKLTMLLKLSRTERDHIFFASNVDK